MTIAEVKADDLFVGLNHAETRLRTEWAAIGKRAACLAVVLLLGGTQIAWIATLGYFAFVFLWS